MQNRMVSGTEKKESSNVCVAQSGINSNSVGSKLMWRGGSICTYVFRGDGKCECCRRCSKYQKGTERMSSSFSLLRKWGRCLVNEFLPRFCDYSMENIFLTIISLGIYNKNINCFPFLSTNQFSSSITQDNVFVPNCIYKGFCHYYNDYTFVCKD